MENKLTRQDFVMAISVTNANINGDPMAPDGRPRVDMDGYGYMSRDCIVHKIRERLAITGYPVFLLPDDRYTCTKEMLEANKDYVAATKEKKNAATAVKDVMLKNWIDARLFGFMIPDKNVGAYTQRGAITFNLPTTVSKVDVMEYGITKCVSLNPQKKKKAGDDEDGDESGKGSDTMGRRSIVRFGLYIVKGSLSPYLADNNCITREDIDAFKDAILHMFEDNTSITRPAGSIHVEKIYWWDHSKNPDAKPEMRLPKVPVKDIFDSIEIRKLHNPDDVAKSMDDYEFIVHKIKGIALPEQLAVKAEYED